MATATKERKKKAKAKPAKEQPAAVAETVTRQAGTPNETDSTPNEQGVTPNATPAPVVTPAAEAAEPPRVPPVATAAAPLPDDPSAPEALALYDAETVRGINDRTHECDAAESEHEEAKKLAKEAKDAFDAANERLKKYARDREANRGKRVTVQPDLPFGDGQTEADGWRALPISAGHFTVEQVQECETNEVTTLGELSEWLTDDGDKGFKDFKDELEAAIKRWESQRVNENASKHSKSDSLRWTLRIDAW